MKMSMPAKKSAPAKKSVVRQDGSPLSGIDQAIMARAAELRRQAGG